MKHSPGLISQVPWGQCGGTAAVIILLVATALAGFYFLNNPGPGNGLKNS